MQSLVYMEMSHRINNEAINGARVDSTILFRPIQHTFTQSVVFMEMSYRINNEAINGARVDSKVIIPEPICGLSLIPCRRWDKEFFVFTSINFR